jgi:hypothetical protein
MQNTGGDQAGLFALVSVVAAVISAIAAGLAWMRATEANTIARHALEAQTATRVNVRYRRGEIRWPFGQLPPPEVVIVVGENVGGPPVTIASAWVMFRGQGSSTGFPLVPTDTGEVFPFPELPQVLAPRSVLQVPVTEQWFDQYLAGHLAMARGSVGRPPFVLRLQDDTGVYFDSPPIRVDRFRADCPYWVQGASDPPPRPSLGERLRWALRGES